MARKAQVRIERAPRRKNGDYASRYKIGRDTRGPWATGPTQAEADDNAYRLGVIAFETVNGPAVETMTVNQWIDRWTRTPGPYTTGNPKRSAPTNRHNAERVTKFGKDHGDKPMAAITKSLALDWAHENASRAGTVRTMFNDALRADVITRNPFSDLQVEGMVKNTRKKIKPLTPKELAQLADQTKVLRAKKWRLMFEACILFSAYTGLRLGEMTALRWTDVDLKNGTINVARQWRTKDNEHGRLKSQRDWTPRNIVLFPQAQAVLEAVRDEYGTHFSTEHGDPDLIFVTQRGRRLNANNHYNYWKPVRAAFLATLTEQRILELAGNDDDQDPLHWHDLRHYTASWLLDNKVAPPDAALQLGHKDNGRLIQELYGHVYEENAKDRMRDAIGNGGPSWPTAKRNERKQARI